MLIESDWNMYVHVGTVYLEEHGFVEVQWWKLSFEDLSFFDETIFLKGPF